MPFRRLGSLGTHLSGCWRSLFKHRSLPLVINGIPADDIKQRGDLHPQGKERLGHEGQSVMAGLAFRGQCCW